MPTDFLDGVSIGNRPTSLEPDYFFFLALEVFFFVDFFADFFAALVEDFFFDFDFDFFLVSPPKT